MCDRPEWDVIVVGAGPAGSIAARQIALLGHRVLLADKAIFPREKVCGCCLNAAAIELLARLGLLHTVSKLQAVPLSKLRLASGGRRALLNLDGNMAISRSALDMALIQESQRAGVEFAQGCTARLGSIFANERRVILNGRNTHTKLVIAADGLAGTLLRDEPGVEDHVSPQSRMGASLILEHAYVWIEPGTIYMACARRGYVGLVRLEDGRLNVAAAFDPAFVREMGGPGAAALQVLGEAGFDAIPQLLDHRWHGTPRLTRHRTVEGPRLFLVGDAAGYVEPFTGEGIAWAIASGAAVAPIAHRMILEGVLPAHQSWTQCHTALLRLPQTRCRVISSALRWPGLTTLMVRLMSKAPWLGSQAIKSVDTPIAWYGG